MVNNLLKNNVIDQLCWDTRIDASRIQVEAEDCIVMLRGEVSSYFEKSAADEINKQIEKMIEYNPNLNMIDLIVTTRNGVVTLKGSVDHYWKKTMIENLTYNMSGVMDVINKITVVPNLDVHDEDIANEIINSIDRNRYLDVNTIDIKVEKGIVTLNGTIPNWYAGETVVEIAEHTLGVKDVFDNLKIE